MDTTILTQREAEDDSDFYEQIMDLVDSELLEDVEYTRLRRLSSEFAQVGGVRDF